MYIFLPWTTGQSEIQKGAGNEKRSGYGFRFSVDHSFGDLREAAHPAMGGRIPETAWFPEKGIAGAPTASVETAQHAKKLEESGTIAGVYRVL